MDEDGVSAFTNGPDDASKDGYVDEFIESLQPEKFEVSVCMVCGRERLKSALHETYLSTYDHEELLKPSVSVPSTELVGNMLLVGSCTHYGDERATGPICSDCREYIHRRRVPPLALCNGLWVGVIPPELERLGLLEQLLIARALTVSYHIHVTAYASSIYRFSNSITIYPLDPSHCLDNALPRSMPLDIGHLSRFLTLTMTGAKSRDFKGKPGVWTVRRGFVEQALEWLQENNTLYQGIKIDRSRLSLLPENGVPDQIREKIKIFRKPIHLRIPKAKLTCTKGRIHIEILQMKGSLTTLSGGQKQVGSNRTRCEGRC